MTAKPKFSAARKPPALTAEQAAYIDGGKGKDQPTAALSEPLTRMSIDLPKRLHKRYKVACALTDIKMAPDLLSFIERRTEELEQEHANPQTHI